MFPVLILKYVEYYKKRKQPFLQFIQNELYDIMNLTLKYIKYHILIINKRYISNPYINTMFEKSFFI